MKRILLPLLFTSVLHVSAQEQSLKRVINKVENESAYFYNPVYFVDSVRVSKEDLGKYNPDDISALRVYGNKKAIELLGEDGKGGVVILAYALAVPRMEDSTVHILIGKGECAIKSEG